MSSRIKIDNSMHALEPAWEDIKREFTVACAQSARVARSQVLYELNQLLRRFLHYESEGDWVRLVIEGASAFCHQAALFALEKDVLYLRAQVNLEVPEVLSFPPDWAGAFETVCTSKEPVTALRTPTEVTEALSTTNSGERAHLFPVTNGSRMAAVLFASDGDDTDVNALELIAGIASSVLERQSNTQLHSKIAVLQQPAKTPPLQESAPIAKASRASSASEADNTTGVTHEAPADSELPNGIPEEASSFAPANKEPETKVSTPRTTNVVQMPSASSYPSRRYPAERSMASVAAGATALETFAPAMPLANGAILPAWADLDEYQRQLHMRAQRFARVTVAEMQLAKPEACRAGRDQGDFYLFLNKEIDKAREIYRRQFMTISSMVDYLHLELVQTSLEGDKRKLGADYPGELV
jgi:hypothetical protein